MVEELTDDVETTPFDSDRPLKTEEDIALYLQAVLAENNPAFFAHAKDMTQLARETCLGREAVYRALSADRNAELATIMKITNALGLHLSVEPGRL